VAEFPPPVPAIGSILLASTDPGHLRGWYERAFGVTADTDGFLPFGETDLLVEGRDDVMAKAAEPARVILNLHVDAQATARHLEAAGVTWLAPLEYREQAGACGGGERAAWFRDSEGNLLGMGQVIPPPPQAGD
jgi:Glyoxalase-like domain